MLTITLSFADSLSDGKDFLVNSVYAIFFSELLISPICVLTDAWGNFQRHFMGPRAPDQVRMNLCFRGGYFQLSERFTVRGCCVDLFERTSVASPRPHLNVYAVCRM